MLMPLTGMATTKDLDGTLDESAYDVIPTVLTCMFALRAGCVLYILAFNLLRRPEGASSRRRGEGIITAMDRMHSTRHIAFLLPIVFST